MACARSDLNEFMNCEICFEVFDKPQSLTCRHVFCLKCVNRIKGAAKITCPVCKVQCNTSDIKPDYRTVAMVDSYRKNLTKQPSSCLAKYESTCDDCDDNAEVSHKCETCEFLLCEKCEASHTVSDSAGGNHTVKAISAIAEEARMQVNTMLKDLNTKEENLEKKLSNRQKVLHDIRQTSDNAMKSITEKEENQHVKIKSHHDNLREEVEKEKAKHVRSSKQEYKNIELCYHELKGNQVILNSLVKDQSDLVIVKTTEKIQKRLQDIEKESSEKQHYDTSAESFTVKVVEGNGYDTKLVFSTNQSMDERQSEAGSIKSPDDKASGSTPSDYTTALYRDYKEEKTVTVDGYFVSQQQIKNIQQHNNHLYCILIDSIYVYTKDLELVKTIKLNQHSISAFKVIKDKYLLTASNRMDDGLKILDMDGKDIQRICRGEFNGLAIHNDKLYVYDHNINKVLIFEQTLPYLWNKTGDIYLNYNGNNEHNAHKIESFLMENEQIYIADDTSIYELDICGKLKRKIHQGKDKTAFKNPKICNVDSKGNILVVEPEISKFTVVGNDGKCGLMLLRGSILTNTFSAFMGDENEHIWLAKVLYHEKRHYDSYLTKYTATSTMSIIM